MHPCTLQQSATPRFARLLLTAALICASAAAAAQTIQRQLDSEGRVSFSDRRDTPITRRELAPLAGQTGPDSEIRGRGRNSSVSHSRGVDKREADRRLSQAMRERARGPDMQQGFPPVAELRPGDRRRARVEALQRMVEAAQARVRELDVLSQLAQIVPHAETKLLAVSALR